MLRENPRAQITGQNTELHSYENDLLPSHGVSLPHHTHWGQCLADWTICHLCWLRIKQIMWQLVRKKYLKISQMILGLSSHKTMNSRMKKGKKGGREECRNEKQQSSTVNPSVDSKMVLRSHPAHSSYLTNRVYTTLPQYIIQHYRCVDPIPFWFIVKETFRTH